MNCPRIVIAGVHSGVGKTSLSLALTAALRRRGLCVQTFKVGPDFLDPTYLTIASGRPCYNLDGWMTSQEYVQHLFTRTTRDADVAVIEGVMGLFDGSAPDTSEGSTAEIARWLDAPVLLVANVHGMARSVAPLVKGYVSFEEGIRIAGVIGNYCGSARHEALLSKALAASSLPRLVGAIPRGALPTLTSRHLGLVTADQQRLSSFVLEEMADAIERHVSLEKILKMAREAGPVSAVPQKVPSPRPVRSREIRLGIARDDAFHFYYQDLFDELRAAGCTLAFFSPLEDRALPDHLDALYVGGGYPEEYAGELTENVSMSESIRQFAASGRPIYAECGGLIYLCRKVMARDKCDYDMVGLLPAATRMLDRRSVLGYVEVTLKADSLWGPKGSVLRGHEFHYSSLVSSPAGIGDWQSVYAVKRRRNGRTVEEGFQREKVLASYVHLHLASHPEAIRHFISCMQEER